MFCVAQMEEGGCGYSDAFYVKGYTETTGVSIWASIRQSHLKYRCALSVCKFTFRSELRFVLMMYYKAKGSRSLDFYRVSEL